MRVLYLLFGVTALTAATPDFSRDVEPILKARCYGCHGSSRQMSGLRLDTREAALRGGYSGPVIIPAKSTESKLIQRIQGTGAGMSMPPGGPKLTDEQIAILRSWIDAGAPWSGGAPTETTTEGGVEEQKHWAFRPVRRAALPEVRNRKWVRNPIDAFILARLEKEGIEPSPEADRSTLLRRLSLDLTGLPPSPDEVSAFLTDKGEGAYERAVDRLLQSRHFGEKWALHWLDLARYADSDGYEKDLYRPHAWRYRHWVIQALNDNMPFDRFTIAQIAGDLLPNATLEDRVATGFHRNSLKNREGGVNPEQFRFEETIDRTNTVGTVWLGLTVGCAQCHDHRYDPFSQRDYYRLFAFFNSLQEQNVAAPLPGETGPFLAALPGYRDKRRKLLAASPAVTMQAEWEAQLLHAIERPGESPVWDRAFDIFQKSVDDAEAILRTPVERRTWRQQDAVTDHFIRSYGQVVGKDRFTALGFDNLSKQLRELARSFPDLGQAQVIREAENRRATAIHIRGSWQNTGIAVDEGTPGFLPPLPGGSEPARLRLARWLVSRTNPLTPRVTANRIWQELFGAGLVRSSDNFGIVGQAPSHPELLDWLATEFVESGWNVKALIRTVVTSAAYRQSSAVSSSLRTRDPANVLLARQSRLRLPGEIVRDSALFASGLLNPEVGGRSIRPPLPAGVKMLGYADGIRWDESRGKDLYRRGLYIALQRSVPFPQLVNFDLPKRESAACTRERSNTPLQSLDLLNDPTFHEAAQRLAVRILSSGSLSLKERIDLAYRICLGRPPDADERDRLGTYYEQQKQIFARERVSAAKVLPVELPDVDRGEAATWVAISSVLLNLDEFVTRN